ncbi:MAG: aminomethyl-transferring glycine dehydrogenase subunit GcvPB, partial [Candidatus Omnitrophica bacterium]|nr:aminomethyl-transferring glycine dehydrogenase subunit GcvPB [Candidatus Omnitrophota bacterium]
MNPNYDKLLFELSQEGKQGSFYPDISASTDPVDKILPQGLRRETPTHLPSVSEPEIVRHYTCLSHKNFSIDTHFYPLGSCTMKYNPRITEKIAAFQGFSNIHPLQSDDSVQGILKVLFDAQEMFAEITGMHRYS